MGIDLCYGRPQLCDLIKKMISFFCIECKQVILIYIFVLSFVSFPLALVF